MVYDILRYIWIIYIDIYTLNFFPKGPIGCKSASVQVTVLVVERQKVITWTNADQHIHDAV